MDIETLSEVEASHYRPSVLTQTKQWIKNKVYQHRIKKLHNILVKLTPNSGSVHHCQQELASWYKEDKDSPNRWMADGTEDLIRLFATQGHSGASAPYAIRLFETIAMFKPWGPLTGAEDEWAEPFYYNGVQQNKRCGNVFRDSDGRAYDIDGIVFRDPDGGCYTNKDSRVYIEFPYTPKTEYVDRPASE